MRVSTAQVICAMGMSVTLHSSLLMLVNDNASTVLPTPIEDVFHVELATLDIEPDFNKEFFHPYPRFPNLTLLCDEIFLLRSCSCLRAQKKKNFMMSIGALKNQ